MHTEETKKKISEGVKKFYIDNPDFNKDKYIESIKKAKKIYLEKVKNEIMNSNYENLKFSRLKKRIFWEQNGKCNKCGLSEWLGRPISLELEHKDGNHNNNDRSNIELLCPNCHSQTDTYRGKNCKYKKNKVSDEQIVETYIEFGNIRQTLLKCGLAAKGSNYGRVKRCLTLWGIPY